MSKTKTVFYCSSCGHESPKWEGKCPACNAWNTYREEKIVTSKTQIAARQNSPVPRQLNEIVASGQDRWPTADPELARILGGGIVPGSLILVGGNPGIGKSTLMLQEALSNPAKVLYVSGEESLEQLKLRASRLGLNGEHTYFITDTDLDAVLDAAKTLQPAIMIIDSIQTLYLPNLESTPGSFIQIRETTGELLRFSKKTHTAVFIIGHITKEGQIAGPKLLEHMVDVVLQFEGDGHLQYRIVRTHKNRFGSADEIGIYEMRSDGLKPVTNPSELLISQTDESYSGSAIGAVIEGQRPLLVETQALVSTAIYGTPQRSATGFDLRRLSMLLAVLEKRCGYFFGQKDVFLNMAGGLRIEDPAIDLAVCAALISSQEDLPIPPKMGFAAEIGLTGEVRAVGRIEQRIAEAERLGFNSIIISHFNLRHLKKKAFKITIYDIERIQGLAEIINGQG